VPAQTVSLHDCFRIAYEWDLHLVERLSVMAISRSSYFAWKRDPEKAKALAAE